MRTASAETMKRHAFLVAEFQMRDKTTLAPSNTALVGQAVQLCAEYGPRPATAGEARQLLELP